MKHNRKEFLKKSVLGMGGLPALSAFVHSKPGTFVKKKSKPIVVSTWDMGEKANAVGWELIKSGSSALDAVEAGVRVVESDPEARTVGYGGFPDRDGNVTLDACIMDHNNNCGAVAFLQHIENPISVARKVMEETPHVMLVGGGALQFALEQGFERKNLLTEQSKKDWEKWLETAEYMPVNNIENHDTIGMLAIDEEGRISGSCTTSGAAYKMKGRVGDSPIIGAGLFIDNEVGGACATGLGEEIIRVAGSAMIVEMMRNGMSPQEACEAIVERVAKNNRGKDVPQAAFLALDINGNYGAYCTTPGFTYAVCSDEIENQVFKSNSRA